MNGTSAVTTKSASPARRRKVSAWIGLGAAGAGASALLLSRDPNVQGSYGVCPFRALTGLDCPFCGGLRGAYALLHGDVLTALGHNVLLPLYVGLGLVIAVSVVRRGELGTARLFSARQWWVLAGLIVAFGVLRNLPMFPYLGSGA